VVTWLAAAYRAAISWCPATYLARTHLPDTGSRKRNGYRSSSGGACIGPAILQCYATYGPNSLPDLVALHLVCINTAPRAGTLTLHD